MRAAMLAWCVLGLVACGPELENEQVELIEGDVDSSEAALASPGTVDMGNIQLVDYSRKQYGPERHKRGAGWVSFRWRTNNPHSSNVSINACSSGSPAFEVRTFSAHSTGWQQFNKLLLDGQCYRIFARSLYGDQLVAGSVWY